MARKKNYPVAAQVEKEVMEIATETFGDLNTLYSLLAILEKINFCNENYLYSAAQLAIKKGIARCNVEIEYANTPCEDGKEDEQYRRLCKKYGVKELP